MNDLERDARLRRELLRSARHGEPGVAHTRTRERTETIRRIHEAAIAADPDQPTETEWG